MTLAQRRERSDHRRLALVRDEVPDRHQRRVVAPLGTRGREVRAEVDRLQPRQRPGELLDPPPRHLAVRHHRVGGPQGRCHDGPPSLRAARRERQVAAVHRHGERPPPAPLHPAQHRVARRHRVVRVHEVERPLARSSSSARPSAGAAQRPHVSYASGRGGDTNRTYRTGMPSSSVARGTLRAPRSHSRSGRRAASHARPAAGSGGAARARARPPRARARRAPAGAPTRRAPGRTAAGSTRRRPRRAPSRPLSAPRADRRLRGGHARDRHAEGRAAHVVEPDLLEEVDAVRVAAVLAADAELDRRVRRPAAPRRRSAPARPRPARRASRTGCARRSSASR